MDVREHERNEAMSQTREQARLLSEAKREEKERKIAAAKEKE